LSWFTESDDDESDAVLDTDEEWSDVDKDDVDKLINVIRSKLPEVDENEREDELKIVKVCVEYFDTKENLFKYLKEIM
jgi:CBS-domain-containing membrane protein